MNPRVGRKIKLLESLATTSQLKVCLILFNQRKDGKTIYNRSINNSWAACLVKNRGTDAVRRPQTNDATCTAGPPTELATETSDSPSSTSLSQTNSQLLLSTNRIENASCHLCAAESVLVSVKHVLLADLGINASRLVWMYRNLLPKELVRSSL